MNNQEFVSRDNKDFQDLLDFAAKWPYAKTSHPDSWVGATEYLDECQSAFDILNEEIDGNVYRFTLSDGRVGVIGRNRVIYERYAPDQGSDVVVAHNYKGPKGGGPEYAQEVLEYLTQVSPKQRIKRVAAALLTQGVMKDHHNPAQDQPGMSIAGWEFGLLRNWRGTFIVPVKTGVLTSLSKLELGRSNQVWIQQGSIDGVVTEEGEHRLMQGSTLTMMSLEDIINL